ncbi:MAG: 4Fe-4S dicluster domain-containing protein [Spirochaetales bacterium]|nr:MAG: 4Fe-4S dicluster domain-containing protein [Spirochaetales bacterium]
MINTPADLKALREKAEARTKAVGKSIRVCIGTGCAAKGSVQLYELFLQAVGNNGAKVTAEAKCVGCHGFCERGPIVAIEPGNIIYQGVEEPDVAEIYRETVLSNRLVERLLYEDPETGKRAQTEEEIPFYRVQRRIVLAQNGRIYPRNIEDYIAVGGYSALVKALGTMKPEDVITEVEISGLRGRGGGGFPTGRKWRSCRNAEGTDKVVICNGDEGDPGAFMDRSVMEGNPHLVLEGLIIGGYAVGASRGYIYVRNEYPLAVEHLNGAISRARELGLLGEDILGSGFSFDVRINRGGGAFVCGESSALIASLEGQRGEPRAKYIHMVESGLHENPTVLNNVETWANIPSIVTKGGAWLASIGTEKSKGTKVFSLVGKVVNTGLVEVPMGMTLRQIIEEIGGGVQNGKKFKAVQTGGPSGGCIPAEHMDTPVDFDELTRLGSMMGSGGMIVMDEDTCMVNVAKYFLSFLKQESCGKCTPCREGVAQMFNILEKITAGEGKADDIDRLEKLSRLIEETSLCALGSTAPNPVLSTLRYFRKEYEDHIHNKHCSAHECKGLFKYMILSDVCTGCRICFKNCPVNAITGERKEPHLIDQEICTTCGVCYAKCPFGAIEKV